MKAQIAALGQRRPVNTTRYRTAAARQQRELARTAAYAESRGCNRTQFLFFGSPPPRQCGAINARISRMRANLAQLQRMISNADGGRLAQQRALMARYDAQCRQRIAVAPYRARGFFDRLFNNNPNWRDGEPNYRDMPIEPPDEDIDREERGPGRGGSKAVCVRTCDGGFFPVSYSARRRTLDDLAELCTALCPNTEAKLFTYSPGGAIDDAVSSGGEPYSSLANAGKFKTSFTPSCTCRPPGQSWAQALRKAEELLDNKSKRDVIVTVEKSKELSKPKLAKVGKKSARGQRNDPEYEAERQRLQLEEDGKRNAMEAAKARAGIDPGKVTRKRVYSLADGKEREVKDAKGVIRKVRIIAPKL